VGSVDLTGVDLEEDGIISQTQDQPTAFASLMVLSD
jgi:hypothetical protein